MALALVEQAVAFQAALAGFDPGVVSGAECARLVEVLAGAQKACAAAVARCAARAGVTAEWLAGTTGTAAGPARSMLETVAELDERCPAAAAAFAAGELSVEQAGEIARTEAASPGSEADLLEVVKGWRWR